MLRSSNGHIRDLREKSCTTVGSRGRETLFKPHSGGSKVGPTTKYLINRGWVINKMSMLTDMLNEQQRIHSCLGLLTCQGGALPPTWLAGLPRRGTATSLGGGSAPRFGEGTAIPSADRIVAVQHPQSMAIPSAERIFVVQQPQLHIEPHPPTHSPRTHARMDRRARPSDRGA